MRSLLWFVLGAAVGYWSDGPGAARGAEPQRIAGWGTVVDPDGDCTVTGGNAKVTVKTPAAKHDLWYGGKNAATRFNAPRVLAAVDGDFSMRVKVSADWDALAPSSTANNYYVGAGLVIWDSPKQYLRWERNVYLSEARLASYVTPIYDRDDQRVEKVKIAWADFFTGRSTWLRIDRYGEEVTTLMSHDGKRWTVTGIVTTEFPAEVQIGIHLINTSTTTECAVEFSDFVVSRR